MQTFKGQNLRPKKKKENYFLHTEPVLIAKILIFSIIFSIADERRSNIAT